MVKGFLRKLIPRFLLNYYYQAFPLLGAVFYRFPSRKLKVIGVTGTNGKSSVVQLTTNILKEAGHKVASVSSVRFQILDKEWQNKLKMTMPGRLQLQKFLRQAVNSGCQYAVLEVTSEGIKQFRHKFINFKVAIFTNLEPEHIESHGSFEKYRQAKMELFKTAGLKTAIVNLDDKNADYFLESSAKGKFGFSANQQLSIINNQALRIVKAEEVEILENGTRFLINGVSFNLKLLGKFNIYNSLAAICAGLSQNIPLEKIKQALEKSERVPGRMEEVVSQPFKVFVDYAHTPDALQKVYETVQQSAISNQQLTINNQKPAMICVLGSCGGGRDKWKRPVMGRLAAKYCQKIILTNEDPYDEPTEIILKDIEQGILEHQQKDLNYELIIDREEAINRALGLAKPGDAVVITGKGSEPWMCVAHDQKIAWDDRDIVKKALERLNLKNEQ